MTTTPQTVLRFLAGAAVAAGVLFIVWYFSAIVGYILVSAVLAVIGRPWWGAWQPCMPVSGACRVRWRRWSR